MSARQRRHLSTTKTKHKAALLQSADTNQLAVLARRRQNFTRLYRKCDLILLTVPRIGYVDRHRDAIILSSQAICQDKV